MRIGKTLFIISVLVCFYSMALALPPGHVESGMKASKPGKVSSLDTRTMINVNNLQMFCTNIGGFAEDISVMLETGKADGLYFPAGTSRSVLYSGGVWIGGTVYNAAADTVGGTPDEIRVAIGAFDAPEYWPGPADEDGGKLEDNANYKIYKIWNDSTVWHNEAKSGIEMADGMPYTRFDSIQHYNDYTIWPSADGAPVDGAGAPAIIGNQMLWAVFNDGGTHEYDGYGGATDSLGVEVQATYFGFDLGGALGNTIFMKFMFINKSPDIIDSCYVSLWADPDLGGSSDDLVGCDTVLSLGYCFNATNNDNTYGSSPPAVGYDFMQGPIIRESDNDPLYASYDFSGDTAFMNTGDTIPQAFIMGLTSFNKYINGTDPDEPEESYGYMRGNDSKSSDGGDTDTPPNDNEENPTKFYHAGDPVKGTGWIDTNPADRRFMCNTGPFTFRPDDTQVVVGSVIVGQAKDRLASVTGLKFYDLQAQFAYDVNFDIPLPPPRPIVTARAYDEKVVLTWGNRSETDYDVATHDFEGYIVYQGETIVGDEDGKWTPIAYFDKKNGIGQLSDFVLDPDLGAVVFIPTTYGTDTDLGYGMEIEQDYIMGGGISNGKTYYYGVTAYSYDFADYQLYLDDPNRSDEDYSVPKGMWYLENRILAIPVTPMDPLAGDSWDYAGDETDATATLTMVDDTQTPATDIITPYVIDPDSITGDDYEVRFVPVYADTVLEIDTTVTPYDTTKVAVFPDTTDLGEFILVQNGFDTVNVTHFWELWNATTSTRLIDRQFNKSGNDNYRVVEGLQVEVTGAYSSELQDVTYTDRPGKDAADNGRAISWVDWGGGYFGNAVDYGINFWGGYLDPATMIDSFMTVELRFTDDIPLADTDDLHGQRAYRYCRGCDPNYGYQDYVQVPFTVWDVPNNRQLNATFVEWVDSDVYDNTWNPDGSDLGGREYLLICRSDYDGDDEADAGTGTIDYTTEDFYDGGTYDWLYAGWFRQRGTRTMDSGDVLTFVFAVPADTNDVYSFSTVPPQRENAAAGKEAIEDIRVVPNPYYAYSAYEVDQFDRQVRFLGLPDEFTIRIFNVAGDMVRTLDWTDSGVHAAGNSWAKWNLLTDQGLPVASGIYIWYIETKFGTKYGKMAIIQEVEQLTTY